jgi:hypothetical protein
LAGKVSRIGGERIARLKEDIPALQFAVESQHGSKASPAQSVPVKETHNGQTVWEGVVHVFDLEGHPKAARAYAWSSPIEGSDKRRFFAVLRMGAIRSPRERYGRRSWRSIERGA